VAGMEIQFGDTLKANIDKNLPKDGSVQAKIRIGDARRIGHFLEELGETFSLIVSNPPYSGDEHMSTLAKDKGKHLSGTFKYQDGLPNLAFLKEGQEYFDTITEIYQACVDHLKFGGFFVTGIKDMMRAKKPFMLHQNFCDLLENRIKLKFVGTAFLKHYPGTQFLHTYFKMYQVHPPYYQTINVWRKG
jgi:methylase of polypeptide subunit release factors